MNWRIAASEIVLVAPLRSENEEEHFDWIKSNHVVLYAITKTTKTTIFYKMGGNLYYQQQKKNLVL